MPSSVLLGGPLGSGTVLDNSLADVGNAQLVQSKTITVPRTATTLDTIFYLPPNSQIVSIIEDRTVAADSATSAALTVGSASAGTQYASSTDLKAAAGRTIPTYTAAQLTAMANITTNTAVYATIVTVGTGTAGTVIVSIMYVQK